LLAAVLAIVLAFALKGTARVYLMETDSAHASRRANKKCDEQTGAPLFFVASLA
jgi:hypothetical protein